MIARKHGLVPRASAFLVFPLTSPELPSGETAAPVYLTTGPPNEESVILYSHC